MNELTINLLTTFGSTFLGVIAGGIITYKLNLKFQSKIIKKQLKIDELKKILLFMNECSKDLLLLKGKWIFLRNTQEEIINIHELLLWCAKKIDCLELEIFLKPFLFKEYDINDNYIKKEYCIVSDLMDYKIGSYEEKVEEYEAYLDKKSIEDRIDEIIKILNKDIIRLRDEYEKDL